MRAAIISVPGREQYLNPLKALLSPEVEQLKIYLDTERRGHWWNLFRCMAEMLNSAQPDEPILITCDDVITIPGWRHYWEQIHTQAQNSIYTFMSRQKFMFTPENIARGYVTKCQKRGFYDHAVIYINQQRLMNRVIDWFQNEGQVYIPDNRKKWLDVVIQDYFVFHNIPWTLTTPTLFNHIGYLSTFKGHDIGPSVNYLGDAKH